MVRVKIENNGSANFYASIDGRVPRVTLRGVSAAKAREIGITAEELQAVFDHWNAAKQADPSIKEAWVDLPEPQAAAPTSFVVRVRPRINRPEDVRSFESTDPTEAFADAILTPCKLTEPLIEWRGTDRLAALDVDFHEVPLDVRPTHADLVSFAAGMSPQPVCAWLTHHRGIRAIYVARGDWRADELVAASVFSVQARWPEATFEIKSVTRHPGVPLPDGSACGPLIEGTGETSLAKLKAALQSDERTDTDGEAEAWLEDRGLEIGKRYSHDRCPFAPSDRGGREPVTVYADGVYCHYCRSQGTRYYASFASLSRGLVASPVATCIRKWVHWEHAQHVVEQTLGLRGDVARLVYQVGLKLVHDVTDADPRLYGVFDRANQLLRFKGFWCNRHGEPLVKRIEPMLAALPACQTVVEDSKTGELKPKSIAARVALFNQTADLDEEGYAAVVPIWGARIATVFLEPEKDRHRPRVVFPSPDLRSHPDKMPRYLADRDTDSAWATLLGPFPGLPRTYIELLVAAKGCAEAEKALPPIVFVSGPSGAGKTAGADIAAAITGDVCSSVLWTPNSERFQQLLMDAALQGTFCVVDEATKRGSAEGKLPHEVLDVILNFKPTTKSHKLFVGPTALGRLPVLVWTDTVLPDEIRADKQLARRMVWVPLTRQIAWEDSMLAHGVDQPSNVRTSSRDFSAACDAILSDVIDRFFREPMPFAEIARRLGFSTLLESGDRTRPAQLKGLYECWLAQPKTTLPYGGDGWVFVEAGHETSFSRLWHELADEGRASSRACSEEDWGKLLGLPGTVTFEARRYGRGVAVRFLRSDVGAGPVQLEPRPEPRRPDRLGDAIGVRLEGFGIKGLPASSFDTIDVSRGQA